MDPSRDHHRSLSDRTKMIRPALPHTPDSDATTPPAPAHHPPSLPPIRHLHPDLPLPALPAQPAVSNGPNYTLAQPAGYLAAASGSNPSARPGQEESDPEGDTQEPPKKKRRRQALSCTECKRRKIKCDRAQPCGPCVRRGEHHKCQWHIIEPMEKYVTRTEYDELKARVSELESVIHRLVPDGGPSNFSRSSYSSPTASMASSSRVQLDPGQGAAIAPYHTGPHASGPSSYRSMAQSLPPSTRRDPSPSYSRPTTVLNSHSPIASSRPPAGHGPPSARPATSHGTAVRPSLVPVSPVETSRSSVSVSSSSASVPQGGGSDYAGPLTSRRASLSLAAITTPFTPASRPSSPPKKYHAQTPPPPGQRLRREPAYSGPAPILRSPHLLRRSPTVDQQLTLQMRA